jgi:hypothetical protein
MIKEVDEEMYNHLLSLKRFNAERLNMKYFKDFVPELQQYRGDK